MIKMKLKLNDRILCQLHRIPSCISESALDIIIYLDTTVEGNEKCKGQREERKGEKY